MISVERGVMTFYIDPGTGSMLFTILIGILGAAVYFIRGLFVRLKTAASGRRRAAGKQEKLPLVMFSDDKRYWVNFRPIADELEKRGQEAYYYTASPDDPALESSYQHIHPVFIGEGNKAFSRMNFLQASIVVATTPGLDVYQWRRSRDVDRYVHITHAPNDITSYEMFGIDDYDALLLSGDYQVHQVRQLEQLRGLPAKECVVAGLPYMDEMARRLAQAGPLPPHPRTVLLAPSWGATAIFARYGASIIDALLATGYHIIVRPHPQSFRSESVMIQSLMQRYPDSAQLEWNRDADNFEVLRRSDIMISDFSGVLFEFAMVYDKPVITADVSYDPSPYDAWWLDEPLWTYEILPKLGPQLRPQELGGLKALIDATLEDPSWAQGRQLARDQAWMHPGEGARRVVDYLLDQLNAEQAKKTEVAGDELRADPL